MLSDPTNIVEALQIHFSSVYSDPNAIDVRSPNFSSPNITETTSDIKLVITQRDIENAISEIKCSSACGPDGIPAKLIKNYAKSLSVPLRIIWQESINIGVVPMYYKKAFTAPIHKKGDKITPGNYRPITLTSHFIKIYERCLRKVITKYLENNEIITKKSAWI